MKIWNKETEKWDSYDTDPIEQKFTYDKITRTLKPAGKKKYLILLIISPLPVISHNLR